jgi:ketosteroid isomerase-like protein
MTTSTTGISVTDLKRAIEERDVAALVGFYADDAVIRVIDRDHPPSMPLQLKGKAQIAAYYGDVCARAMTHQVDSGIADAERLAFTQACAYPDGTRVYCAAMLDLSGGKIVRQTTVQAWDG